MMPFNNTKRLYSGNKNENYMKMDPLFHDRGEKKKERKELPAYFGFMHTHNSLTLMLNE